MIKYKHETKLSWAKIFQGHRKGLQFLTVKLKLIFNHLISDKIQAPDSDQYVYL